MTTDRKLVSIVVPAHNEQHNVALAVNERDPLGLGCTDPDDQIFRTAENG